ncbi:hypothetical protein BKP45_14540 [Anaerobacillus alkalidiazotrophicus]|uniref:Tagatose-6-phosphate kinase n=1 Tax=Anaerobacillus alkalidiazotrophicus TaxID=472963 RepID=A0A1S2M2U2_9BACI|nr:1-phosphofructokinase family hexose kinase [Anaerobacillus alkalidiazotrophicus]OIJ18944.1 hypothetical protein BKP45_14540 [Anaerobacillus alkalidiazotrophicus]
MIYTVTLNTAIDKIIKINGVLTRKMNNKIRNVSFDIGGKATHVSVVLSKLNINNIATGFVGSENALTLTTLLKNKGVTCDFISQENCSTRESLVILDDSGNGSFMITESGFEILEESQCKLVEKLSNQVTKNDYVVFAGSPPRGFNVDQYINIVKTVTDKGGKLIIDASGDYLREAIKLKPYLIKPNEFEFQELVGKPLNTIDEFIPEMKKLLNDGIEFVVVSLGKKGSLVGTKQSFYRVIPPVIKEINDTGCGDVFVGGLVASLYKQTSIEDMLEFSTALSASKASQNESSSFCLKQTKQLEAEVKIEKLEAYSI